MPISLSEVMKQGVYSHTTGYYILINGYCCEYKRKNIDNLNGIGDIKGRREESLLASSRQRSVKSITDHSVDNSSRLGVTVLRERVC